MAVFAGIYVTTKIKSFRLEQLFADPELFLCLQYIPTVLAKILYDRAGSTPVC